MRKHVLWLALIFMAVYASAAVSTQAQHANGVRGDVPFDFIVGNTTIPAGKISVRRPTSSEAGALSISNLDSGQYSLRMGRTMLGTDISGQGKLVFRKYGNRYYLAQVWIPDQLAWEVLKSTDERAVEREMRVAKNSKPELVTVFAGMQ